MAASLEDFYPEVLSCASGLGDPVADANIRLALEEFCRKTLFWQYTPAAINVVATTHTYALAPPANTLVANVVYAAVNGIVLDPASADQMDLEWPKRRTKYPQMTSSASTPWREETNDQAYLYHLPDPKNIRIIPIPTVAITGGLTMILALRPTRTATTVDDLLFEEAYEAIAHGAKARILAIPNRIWTDYPAAAYFREMFEQDISDYTGRRVRDHTRQNKTVLRTRAYSY